MRSRLLFNAAITVLLVFGGGKLGRAADPVPQLDGIATAFTYQGQVLQNGQPVNAVCDFEFQLFDAAAGGSAIGEVFEHRAVRVLNGLFAVTLDFGASPFTGAARWIEQRVRCPAGSGTYIRLFPRAPVSAMPYAILANRSLSAATVDPAFTDGLYWRQGGNRGTSQAVIGTTDLVSLTIVVGGLTGYRILPTGRSPNLVGGIAENGVNPGGVGITIGGGGSAEAPNQALASYGTIGGGAGNQAETEFATVGGGSGNRASGAAAQVGGGTDNSAAGAQASVGGGQANQATGVQAVIGGGAANRAPGTGSAIGGGSGNVVSGTNATIAGGYQNETVGEGAAIGGGVGNRVIGPNSTIGGGAANRAEATGVTIGGGTDQRATGQQATVAGGGSNVVTGSNGTIAGGFGNQAGRDQSTVGGGFRNQALGENATIAGGFAGVASGAQASIGGGYQGRVLGDNGTVGGGFGNIVTGTSATIAGGAENRALGVRSTVPGGFDNQANGPQSLAAGSHARANGAGCFVWGDASTTAPVGCDAPNAFVVRASGGVSVYTSSDLTLGVRLPPNGNGWDAVSDRALKVDHGPVAGGTALRQIVALPVQRWTWRSAGDLVNNPVHIGPMAQEFQRVFGLGDGTTISTADLLGLTIAALQGLADEVDQREEQLGRQEQRIDAAGSRLRQQEAEIAALRARVDDQEARLRVIEQHVPGNNSSRIPIELGAGMLFGGAVVWLVRSWDDRVRR